ncbi:MAG: PLD nuclease N-terminal domain-containing protein [Prolixibacteraceae bacterium]|nr:PLD nuclease N-terminal domain-containing protein [Prolixibacteraceae bacterium]
MSTLGFIGGLEFLFILFLIIFFWVFTIIALIDILKSNFESNNKLIWVLVVIFTNIIGAILYFTIGRKQKIS